MVEREAQAAWRLFSLNWIPVFSMAAALSLGLMLTRFSLRIETPILAKFVAASLFTIGAYFIFARVPRSRVSFIVGSLAQMMLLSLLTPPLTYIAAAADLPLQDANFAYLDHMIGFHWPAYFTFFYERPALTPYVFLGYAMIVWPVFAIPIILGACRHYRRLQQFTLACALTLIVTTTVSALLPAIGAYGHYHVMPDLSLFKPGAYLTQLHDVPLIRDGSLRVLNASELTGIVTFPSFHASAAILFLWAFWSVWWMRPLAVMANFGMLLVTPVVGGHYITDVFAGALLAVLAIGVAKAISELSIGVDNRAMAPPALAALP